MLDVYLKDGPLVTTVIPVTLAEFGFAWNQGIWQCAVLYSNSQQITIQATNSAGLKLYLTVVHGSNWQIQRAELWSSLEHVNNINKSGSWIVVGDF